MSKSGKGSGFERELAKQLSLWWSHGDRDDLIWRTSQSGGRATQRAKRAVRTKYGYGDLTFTDPTAKPLFDLLVISAKRGYTNTSKPLLLSDVTKQLPKLCRLTTTGSACDKEVHKLVSNLFSKTKKTGGIDLLDAIDKPDKKCNMLSRWIDDCYRDTMLSQLPYWLLIFRRDGGQACCVMQNELHEALASSTFNNKMTLMEHGAHCIRINNRIGNELLVVALEDFLSWCVPSAVEQLSNKLKGAPIRGTHD